MAKENIHHVVAKVKKKTKKKRSQNALLIDPNDVMK